MLHITTSWSTSSPRLQSPGRMQAGAAQLRVFALLLGLALALAAGAVLMSESHMWPGPWLRNALRLKRRVKISSCALTPPW